MGDVTVLPDRIDVPLSPIDRALERLGFRLAKTGYREPQAFRRRRADRVLAAPENPKRRSEEAA